MEKSHEILWAKSVDEEIDKDGNGESLFQHSLNVANNARKICERLPFPANERAKFAEILVEAGALHDIGKAASGFQKMLARQRLVLGTSPRNSFDGVSLRLKPES